MYVAVLVIIIIIDGCNLFEKRFLRLRLNLEPEQKTSFMPETHSRGGLVRNGKEEECGPAGAHSVTERVLDFKLEGQNTRPNLITSYLDPQLLRP